MEDDRPGYEADSWSAMLREASSLLDRLGNAWAARRTVPKYIGVPAFWAQRPTVTFVASECGRLPLAIRVVVGKLPRAPPAPCTISTHSFEGRSQCLGPPACARREFSRTTTKVVTEAAEHVRCACACARSESGLRGGLKATVAKEVMSGWGKLMGSLFGLPILSMYGSIFWRR